MLFEEAKVKLEAAGQEHVLRYYDELTEEQKKALLDQIELTDFSVISSLAHKDDPVKQGKIEPMAMIGVDEIEARKEEFTEAGLEMIRAGKVAAVMLAGGMGTRLGSDDPKGMYNIGETKPVYIFQRQIENLQDVVKLAGVPVHLFIMTSDKNNDKTVAFLNEHDFFGYDKEYVHFFRQEMAPASDYSGKVYMEDKYIISTSPNGNGGWFSSMVSGGMLDIIKEAGIEYLNAFSVDNVLQRMADPCFVGATLKLGYTSGSKVVSKVDPYEKVGALCLEDGHPTIVEYYGLNDEMANEKNEKGELAYGAGVILNYLFRVDKLEEILSMKMPLHVVEKKIPYMDEEGVFHKPEAPNGYKFETLILDMIRLMDDSLPYEVVRNREFAPIKNKTGVDSVESARALCKENGIEL